jgi:hypothetical protein
VLADLDGLFLLEKLLAKHGINRPAFGRLISASAHLPWWRGLNFTSLKKSIESFSAHSESRPTAIADVDRSQFGPTNPAEYLVRCDPQ